MIFAAPRCSEIPELSALRNVFEKKYGKDFVSAATDLRPNCGVNRLVFTLSASIVSIHYILQDWICIELFAFAYSSLTSSLFELRRVK